MTSDQLQRRYDIFSHARINSTLFNLAAVSRWYGSQDETTRQDMEMSEPLSWLKHLPRRTLLLSRRHLSARIIENFITAQTAPSQPQLPPQPHSMEPISEDHSIQDLSRPLTREHSPERVYLLADKLRVPRDSFDAESRRSVDSFPSSIISNSSNLAMSPVPSVQQNNRSRAKTPSRLEYVGSGEEDSIRMPATANTSPEQPSRRIAMSTDNTNMWKRALTNFSDTLPMFVPPVSDTEERSSYRDKESAPSSGIRSRSDIDLAARKQRFSHSSLPRRQPVSDPPLEDPQKEIEIEEALRREYAQKAACVQFSLSRTYVLTNV